MSNYFESPEWQEIKRQIDEKIKSKKPEPKQPINRQHFTECSDKVKIDWELVKLFNTGR